jgi:CRISPR-associated Csx2 family protein
LNRFLIGTLGTGPTYPDDYSQRHLRRQYSPAIYSIDGCEYSSDFIADALIKHFQPDHVILLGTVRSMWERVYERFAGEDVNEEYYVYLDDKIASSSYKNQLLQDSDLDLVEKTMERYSGVKKATCKIVRYGLNDEELLFNYQIFQQIAEELEDGDTLYLDITHGFRSLALFQYTMLSYLENLTRKKVRVAGVYYGMQEVRNDMGGRTPIVNLYNVYLINYWIRAIHELESYGNGYLVADLVEATFPQMAGKMRMFSDLMNLNYLGGIKRLWKSLEKLDFSSIQGPAGYVSGYIDVFIQRFSTIEQASLFQLELARWYFENKRYATGYICLLESMVTRVCELMNRDTTVKENRDEAKKVIKGWNFSDSAQKLKEEFRTVNAIRVNVAHALDERNEQNYRSDIDNCIKRCNNLENIYKEIKVEDFGF